MEEQVKEPTTVEQQLILLCERGMAVDVELARQWLRSVSYYRLFGYWYPYRVLVESDPRKPVRLDEFVEGTTFGEIAGLYEFDRKLRTLVHDGIERIEVALRTRIGEWIVSHGTLAYRDSNLLFRPEFGHESWLETARLRIERAQQRNASIKHYAEKYREFRVIGQNQHVLSYNPRIVPPELVITDGGSGFAKACKRIWPTTRVRRCTFHA